MNNQTDSQKHDENVSKNSYDVIVVGAGTAGLKAAKTLKKNDANYLIVEKGQGGTLCADTGCMPSKALIEAANAYHARKKFYEFGVRGAEHVFIDIPSVLMHVRFLRDKFVHNVQKGMKEHPVLHGQAKFLDQNTLRVGDKTIRAEKIIISTGSTPRVPNVFKAIEAQLLTTDTLFDQSNLPPSMAIVGMGSVGVEMGQALSRLGIEVFAIQRTNTLAGISDPDVNAAAQETLETDMHLYMNTEITKIETSNSHYHLFTNKRVIEVSGVLVSAGRRPNFNDLGLGNLNISFSEKGVPEFDKNTLQINNAPIYIAGDVNDDQSLQHVAAHEGERAAKHALGLLKKNPKRETPLKITFSDPPIVFVGQRGDLGGTASYDNQTRAVLMQKDQGKAKLYASEDGTITGAEMIAPAADHMAHFLLIAIENEMKAKDILDLPFYHPTLEEGLRKALAEINTTI